MLKSNLNPEISQVVPFHFETHELRTLLINDEPYFVAKDICIVLGIQNVTQALSSLDDDERAMQNIGRQGEANCINESGLYALIMRSNKPEAKRFRKWVTNEVLPSIRKTGQYVTPSVPDKTALSNATVKLVNAPMVQMEVLSGIHAYVIPDEQHRYFITKQEMARVFKVSMKSLTSRKHRFSSQFVKGKHYEMVNVVQGSHGVPNMFFTQSGLMVMAQTFKGGVLIQQQNTASNMDVELLEMLIQVDDKALRINLFNNLKNKNIL
jgi:prophage antirepressor-like protein